MNLRSNSRGIPPGRLLALAVVAAVPLAASVVRAAPIGPGDTTFVGRAVQDVTISGGTFFNTGPEFTLPGVSGVGYFTIHREAQVLDSIAFVGGDSLYEGDYPGLGHYTFGTGGAVGIGGFHGTISDVVQDPGDPGFASGDPSSFASGHYTADITRFYFRLADGTILETGGVYTLTGTLDGLPPRSPAVLGGSATARNPIYYGDPSNGLVIGYTTNGAIEAVPEPSSVLLLGAGAALIGLRLGRRALARRGVGRAVAGVAAAVLVGLAAPARADLFVSTYSRGGPDAVQEYTNSGDFVGTFVAAGSGGLSNAGNLHFGPDGDLYVAGDQGIKVYDGSTGAYLRDFTTAYTLDFTFDGAGHLFAVDNEKVVEYAGDGSPIRTFTDGVSTPQGIVLGADGRLLVTDTYSGAYRDTITSLDPTDGSFTTFATGLGEPIGIAAGPGGRYFVANFTFANSYGGTNPDTVQVIPAAGGASSTWNHGGDLHGATYLAFAGGRLFVTSFYSDTVQVFDATTGNSLGGFGVDGGVSGIAVRPEAVPEPSALVLLAAGGAGVGLGLARRARRDRQVGASRP